MTGKKFSRELIGWFAGIFILIIALIAAIWYPIASMIILAISLVIGAFLERLAK
jgi:hypothetical protein